MEHKLTWVNKTYGQQRANYKESISDKTYICGSDTNKRPIQYITVTGNAGNGGSNNRDKYQCLGRWTFARSLYLGKP